MEIRGIDAAIKSGPKVQKPKSQSSSQGPQNEKVRLKRKGGIIGKAQNDTLQVEAGTQASRQLLRSAPKKKNNNSLPFPEHVKKGQRHLYYQNAKGQAQESAQSGQKCASGRRGGP